MGWRNAPTKKRRRIKTIWEILERRIALSWDGENRKRKNQKIKTWTASKNKVRYF